MLNIRYIYYGCMMCYSVRKVSNILHLDILHILTVGLLILIKTNTSKKKKSGVINI